jgi:hypothetical protein
MLNILINIFAAPTGAFRQLHEHPDFLLPLRLIVTL